MEAGNRNVANIFNRTSVLKLPHFQRSYVWKEEQWNRFLEDMEYVSRTNRPYFMGSIIIKQQQTASDYTTRDVRTVVDGQQRLTTILLFFKALTEKIDSASTLKTLFKTFNDEIILEHNYLDKPIFDKIMLDHEITEEEKEKAVYKCYEYFLNSINDRDMKPINLLTHLLFVGIDLQSTDDEQQIFDTINSLGVSLTTAELLKNHLFKDDLKSYNDNWRDVFEKDDETRDYWVQEVTSGRQKRANIDMFLQSYLFIKIQEKNLEVKAEHKERFSRIDSIFRSYKEFIKDYLLDNKEVIIKELKEYAAVYREIIDPKISEKDFDKNNSIKRLNLLMFALDTTTIIPYVLYIAKKVGDEAEKSKIFRYLESYLIRRIICRETTKNYNRLFGTSLINNEVSSLVKLKEIIELKSEKINFMPTDEDVKNGFNESILQNPQTLTILYLMEKTVRSDLNSTALKPFDEYSLEHILPRKWRNNWDKLDEDKAEEIDRILGTLGNLTIITGKLNSSIRDSDWPNKKAGSGKNKGLTEYAQGIEIFTKYLQRDVWNEDTIKERTKELSDHALKVWNQ